MSNQNGKLPRSAVAMERDVQTGDFWGALEHFHGLDPAVRQMPHVEMLAATAAARLGDWQQATSLGLSVLEHSRHAGDRECRLRALSLLGAMAFEHGSLDDAEAQLLEALEIARELEDRHTAPKILNNLASVAHVQGRIPEALARYEEAIKLYHGEEDERGMAETYHNVALVHRQEKAWSEAHEALRFAMRYSLAVAEPSLLALVHMGSSELYLDQSDFERAESQLDVAAQLLRGVDDMLGQAEWERVRARLELAQGNLVAAHRHAAAGEAAAASGGDPILKSQCAAVGATVLKGLGDDDAAAKHDNVVETMKELGASLALDRFERQWAGVA